MMTTFSNKNQYAPKLFSSLSLLQSHKSLKHPTSSIYIQYDFNRHLYMFIFHLAELDLYSFGGLVFCLLCDLIVPCSNFSGSISFLAFWEWLKFLNAENRKFYVQDHESFDCHWHIKYHLLYEATTHTSSDKLIKTDWWMFQMNEKKGTLSHSRPKQEESPHIDPKVLAVYKGVGNILKRYTTGRLPKAFKIIPNLQNWEEVGLSFRTFPILHVTKIFGCLLVDLEHLQLLRLLQRIYGST